MSELPSDYEIPDEHEEAERRHKQAHEAYQEEYGDWLLREQFREMREVEENGW